MDKISFLTFTDIHVSDHSPQNRRGSYKGDILGKLDQIGLVGKKLGVDFYMCGGDLYDLKAPTRNSHNLNTELTRVFKGYGAPIYTTEGNHDLRNDSYVNFSEQPLSVLYESGTLVQLRDEVIEKGNLKVGLRAFPFEENPDFPIIPKAPNDTDCNVCIMHVYSTPEGGWLFKQRLYSYNEIGVTGDDIYLMGHYHLDQGVQIVQGEKGDQHFINVGAISRGALSEDNIKRSPKICLVTIEKNEEKVTIKTQQIRLRVKPAEEIFDLDKKEEEKNKIKEAESFVEKLRETITEDMSEKDTIEGEVDKLDIEQEVIKKVKGFISEASLKVQDVLK